MNLSPTNFLTLMPSSARQDVSLCSSATIIIVAEKNFYFHRSKTHSAKKYEGLRVVTEGCNYFLLVTWFTSAGITRALYLNLRIIAQEDKACFRSDKRRDSIGLHTLKTTYKRLRLLNSLWNFSQISIR
jgi:hypothetical protein